MANRVLIMLALFSCVAVSIPILPAQQLKEETQEQQQCREIRAELEGAVRRGQLTWSQVKPIIKRCDKVEFR